MPERYLPSRRIMGGNEDCLVLPLHENVTADYQAIRNSRAAVTVSWQLTYYLCRTPASFVYCSKW